MRHQVRFWHSQLTIVQLRYTFLTEVTNGSYQANLSSGLINGLRPIDLERAFFSFWDMDTGEPAQHGGSATPEAMQMGPQSAFVVVGHRRDDNTTEVVNSSTWAEALGNRSLDFLDAVSAGNWTPWEWWNPLDNESTRAARMAWATTIRSRRGRAPSLTSNERE
jgi:hypothetical protein